MMDMVPIADIKDFQENPEYITIGVVE